MRRARRARFETRVRDARRLGENGQPRVGSLLQSVFELSTVYEIQTGAPPP